MTVDTPGGGIHVQWSRGASATPDAQPTFFSGSHPNSGQTCKPGRPSQSGLAHSAAITSANVHDIHPLPDLLHGREQRTHCNGVVNEALKSRNRNKSKIRARVDHVFGVVKRL